MKLFSEKVEPTFTNSSFNILQVENYSEIFFDVYEIELNKIKYPAEKISSFRGNPVVSVPVVIGEKEQEFPFVLVKGNESIFFNENNIGVPIDDTPLDVENTDALFESVDIDHDHRIKEDTKREIMEHIENAKVNARKQAESIKREKLKEADTEIRKKNNLLKESLNTAKQQLVNEFISITKSIKRELINEADDKYSELTLTIDNKINDLADHLAESIQSDFENSSKELETNIRSFVKAIHNESVLPELRKSLETIATDAVVRIKGIESDLDKKLTEKVDVSVIEDLTSELDALRNTNIELNNSLNKGVNKALSRVGNVNNRLDEAVADITKQVDDKISATADSISSYYSDKLQVLEDQTFELNEKSRQYVVDIVRESRDNLISEIRKIQKEAPVEFVIESAGKKKTKTFDSIQKDIDKKISDRVSDEVIKLRKYIAVYSGGGGTVAQQFADGGTMNGNLTVVGAISASQYLGIPGGGGVSGDYLPLSGGKLTGGLTVQGTISSSGPITADSTVTVWRGGGQEISNTAVGYQSLCSNSFGYGNTANGYTALYYNDTGYSNTAIGSQALYFNTDGNSNTAIGFNALISNTLGVGNIATGSSALGVNDTGSYNVATGRYALFNNQLGNYNVAIGDDVLGNINLGDNNIAIGSSAGNTISGGAIHFSANNSIYLGANTKALENGETNQIVIGYDTTGIGSNTVTLGNDSIITTALKGNVGIGTTSPNATLTVNGTLSAGNTYLNSLVLNDGLSATKYSLLSTSGEFVASKSVLGWAFGNTASPILTADGSPTGVHFKPDGTVMFVLGATNRRVYSYNLSSSWNVSTASATPSLSTIQLDLSPESVRFSPDGRYMFVVSSNTDAIKRYTMSAGNEWNISTITTNDQSFTLPSTPGALPRGLCFKPDGTKMYIFDDNNNNILEYTLSPAWTVTGATLANSVLLQDSIREIDISSDGKRILAIVDGLASLDIIYEYTLPTAWSVSGMYIIGRMFRSTDATAFPAGGPFSPESGPSGIYYNDLLNKCFFVGTGTDRVQEIIVTPQPAIIGTRPVILSNTLNSVADRVTINSLQITDTTNTNSSSTGALIVNGGISCGGNMVCGGGGAAFSYQVGAGGVFWSSSTGINAPSDGVLRLANTAVNGFNRLQLGGSTDAFPAIATNGSSIDIRFASLTGALTDLRARNLTATGIISGGTITNGVNTLLVNTSAVTDMRIQLGGIDVNFPAIKRNGSGLDIVNAADTVGGFTDLRARNITLSGGDLEIGATINGVILKSPNGTRYRITVDNSGALITTTVV